MSSWLGRLRAAWGAPPPPKSRWPASITIVRHGQSLQNVCVGALNDRQDTLVGTPLSRIRDSDMPLTTQGHWQAEKTGHFLTQQQFDVCFCSPYLRTVQTAQSIVAHLAHKPIVYEDDRLREKEFGRLFGLTLLDIQTLYPQDYADSMRDRKYYYRLPGGENYCDVSNRVHSFVGTLSRSWTNKHVLIVTHHVPYVMFRHLFEYLGERGILALPHSPNCAVQQWQTDAATGRLTRTLWNHVAYDKHGWAGQEAHD